MAWPSHTVMPVEILDLRHFTSADLRPLLEHEARVWSRLLSWDYRSSADMILRYVDAKILPGYAAVDHGHIRGYSFFVYEGSKGVIGDLYAMPNGNDSLELEEQLVTNVIATLQQSPGIHRIEAQLLVHDAGQVAEPFLQEGFTRHPRIFMSLPFTAQLALKPRDVPSGIELRPWQEQDYQASAAVIAAAYRGHIDSDINDQYRSLNGSLRFLNNIVRFPGCGIFDPTASFVVIDRHTQQLVGVLLCSRVKDDVGHVTQVCLVPELRRLGIGEALIAACAANLKQRGFKALSLTVTEANSRAVELYKRLGFHSDRVFDAFVWEG
ncbi:MAG TPA: GNAT family N-acetyltransferase [Candidatus Koribacter sp.]